MNKKRKEYLRKMIWEQAINFPNAFKKEDIEKLSTTLIVGNKNKTK